MQAGRCVGGIPWAKDAPRPQQTVLKLTECDAWALKAENRLERLQNDIGRGVHFQLLQTNPRCPRLVITGPNEVAVAAAQGVVEQFLRGSGGLTVAVHPYDADTLQRQHCQPLADMERESGCRMIVENRQRLTKKKPDLDLKHSYLHLVGDQVVQARAIDLLAQHCTIQAFPDDSGRLLSGSSRSSELDLEPTIRRRRRELQAFDHVVRGVNVQLASDGTVARRVNCDGTCCPFDCVVAGAGLLTECDLGCWCCLGVRQVDQNRQLRGGTRISISTLPIKAPVPRTLQSEPDLSWVCGRGSVRGPDGASYQLPPADFDMVAEGSELGVLVTKDKGSVAIFQRPTNNSKWECVLHWAAEILYPNECHMAIELAGRLLEVQFLQRMPPSSVDREIDFPVQESGQEQAAIEADEQEC